MNDHAILSRPYDTAHLPATGVDMEFAASDEQRAALAAAYDLVAMDRLSASATLTPGAGGLVAVSGRVVADIVQSCVVSLEPVAQHIDETFAVDFAPAGRPAAKPPLEAAREVAIDPEAPDPPEPMAGTSVDVGALVEEMFVLAIDPYPRAPGAELPAGGGEEFDSGRNRPLPCCAGSFAAASDPGVVRRRAFVWHREACNVRPLRAGTCGGRGRESNRKAAQRFDGGNGHGIA